MTIYTKNGDKGVTSLYDNQKIKKDNQVFEVIGTLDELNSFLGMVHTSRQKDIKKIVLKIQNDLLDIGALIAGKEFSDKDIKYWADRVNQIEAIIDDIDSKNTPLKQFILPGGSSLSSQLHLSRSISRRLERRFVEFNDSVNNKFDFVLRFLNRISDLLFVLARYNNKVLGVSDIVWEKNTL